VLVLAHEIQSGLGRCGTTCACEREDVLPDVYMLGKALGGGIVPVSAVVSRNDVLGVITPGSHGSTRAKAVYRFADSAVTTVHHSIS
jgi:ornithine--oxo-acid transaminase